MDNAFWQALALNLLNAMIPVLMTALPVVLAAVFALLVQYIRLVQGKIQAQYPTQYQKLEAACSNAVKIAEQMKIGGFIEDKKQFAVDYAQKEMDRLGIKVDISVIEQEIEKAVYNEIGKTTTAVITTDVPSVSPSITGNNEPRIVS